MSGRGDQADEDADTSRADSPDLKSAGEVLRPEIVVLGDDALIPASNVVEPPQHLTHELIVDEPYWFDRPGGHGDEPDGVFPAGTAVSVLVEDNGRSRVADQNGLSVDVRRMSLRRLPEA